MPAGRPRSDRQLAHCREAGLSCRECVAAAAENVAAIAADLNSSLARQFFFLIFPEQACAGMATEFVQILNGGAPRSEPLRAVPATEAPVQWRAAVA
ncbi:MAG: hypothetical protein KatS3mg005_0336 [Bryobacteraceae bacterium]|nr:MAG: hypothetical protein KatS3mg005_0336 [Bryobacteraceae bacterium]